MLNFFVLTCLISLYHVTLRDIKGGNEIVNPNCNCQDSLTLTMPEELWSHPLTFSALLYNKDGITFLTESYKLLAGLVSHF